MQVVVECSWLIRWKWNLSISAVGVVSESGLDSSRLASLVLYRDLRQFCVLSVDGSRTCHWDKQRWIFLHYSEDPIVLGSLADLSSFLFDEFLLRIGLCTKIAKLNVEFVKIIDCKQH